MIYDCFTATAFCEMKWYNNVVSGSFQIRMEMFYALAKGKEYILITKNGVLEDLSGPLQGLFKKYPDKIKIEKFISQ